MAIGGPAIGFAFALGGIIILNVRKIMIKIKNKINLKFKKDIKKNFFKTKFKLLLKPQKNKCLKILFIKI